MCILANLSKTVHKYHEGGIRSFYMSRTVSRVMSWMIIYLVLPSPTASSDPPENEPGKLIALCSVLLRMGFTWLLMLPPAR